MKIVKNIIILCLIVCPTNIYTSETSTETTEIQTTIPDIQEQSRPLLADLVIFSYDRPLQLYALLESIEKYITGIGQTYIIYRTSNAEYADAYEVVHKKYPSINFIQQAHDPEVDFKPLTLQATFDSPNEYILYAVDDIIVKDSVDLSACIQLLEKYKVYGFFLRLGLNLDYCYSMFSKQRYPKLYQLEPDLYAWQFYTGEHDWGYPHTVDMALYRKKDIKSMLHEIKFKGPNSFEGEWAGLSRSVESLIGLCFEQSKIVNVPLNRVQTDYGNRAMNFLRPEQLLDIFNIGKKIDISKLHKINNKSAHMEYVPVFVER